MKQYQVTLAKIVPVLVALGFKQAPEFSIKRCQAKVDLIPEKIDDESVIDNDKSARATLGGILAATARGEEVVVVEKATKSSKKEETKKAPAKKDPAPKGAKKKAPAKKDPAPKGAKKKAPAKKKAAKKAGPVGATGMADEDVQKWIKKSGIESRNGAHKAFRAEGNSCSDQRFKRIWDSM